MFDSIRFVSRSIAFLIMTCFIVMSLVPEQAQAGDPWITALTGIRKNQIVTGKLYVQTHVTNLDTDADYDLRYQIDGPSGFI